MRETDWQHFKVRLSPDMHERLKVAAAQNRRSMSQEIMARLEATFGNDIEDGEWLHANRAMPVPREPEPAKREPAPRRQSASDRNLQAALAELHARMAAIEARIGAEADEKQETERKQTTDNPVRRRK